MSPERKAELKTQTERMRLDVLEQVTAFDAIDATDTFLQAFGTYIGMLGAHVTMLTRIVDEVIDDA